MFQLRPARLATIAAGQPFADVLARRLIAETGGDALALANITIYLPTRRAARTFAETFARVLGGAALLPDFRPLGDADEDELLFDPDSEGFDRPPAIAPMRRQLLLAMLVRRWNPQLGFAQATGLAGGLARLMDDVDRQGADLSKLADLAPTSLAEHWTQIKDFLGIIAGQWPALLVAEQRIDPAKRRNQLLRALAARLEAHPPQSPVIAAGSTGSIPATAELLGVIARLPQGIVVLPGLDRALDEESWHDLDPGHPQYGMQQLLERIGVARNDVAVWGDDDTPREKLLRETLRPAPTTDAWRALAETGTAEFAHGLAGLTLVAAADPAEEALTIALTLRALLENPGQTAALVTPDRTLARRVASELGRWDIDIDDSSGVPLSHTPPGSFLCLLAEAADAGFAPVALLALLKHPLARLGQEPGDFRRMARALDKALRGAQPDAGLAAIAERITKLRNRNPSLEAWFATVSAALRPLGDAFAQRDVTLSDIVTAHLQVAERLSRDESGVTRLGFGDDGAKSLVLMEELKLASEALPPIEASAYAPLFREFAAQSAVRPAFGKHPRLSILGPLEARLQSFDLVVLGGLNEGTWPVPASSDPWFSRPMLTTLGLEQPERAIGLSAHDFATLAAGPRVLLTRATKAQGTPTVTSRWVQRLIQLTSGLGLESAFAPKNAMIALARSLNAADDPKRIPMPRPTPPVEARPDHLPVTAIETWLRDPYAIYARRILNLTILDALEEEIGPLERGTAVHLALERFVRDYPGALPDDAVQTLCDIADQVFAEHAIPQAALALWRPRFRRAAEWFVEQEATRRPEIATSHIEIEGRYAVTPEFTLTAKADRIDILVNGMAAILDYKTGQLPSRKQLEALLAPQLPLEAVILAADGFPGLGARDTQALLYLQISGGRIAGKVGPVDPGLAYEALERLRNRIAAYRDVKTTYAPRLHPKEARVSGDYDHLSRVREWSISGWEAPDE